MAHTENDGSAPIPMTKAVKRKDRKRTKKQGKDKWPSEKVKPDLDNFMEWLTKYVEDMHVWGQRVRKDIRKLEEHTGLGHGDPGDPPAGPWT